MIRINDSKSMTTLKAAVLVSAFLLFAAATGFGQQVVNLTAGPNTTTLPDGTTLPMWGYTCGTAATGSTATCAALSGSSSGAATGALGGIYVLNGGSGYTTAPSVTIVPNQTTAPTTAAVATAIVSGGVVVGFNVTNHGAGYTAAPTVTLGGPGSGAVAVAAPAWSPVLITVPFVAGGASLTINLTNNLSFTPAGGGSANNIPTSIVMVGQVGGGLGSSRTTTPSPSHTNVQGCPTWFIANPGIPGSPCTSQVTTSSGPAFGVPPAQGPRVQSMATEVPAVAAGTVSVTPLTWTSLRPGTYLLESGTHPSIQVPMGLIGVLVVTTVPTSTTAGIAYPSVPAHGNAAAQAAIPAVQYNAEVPLEFSEIDPVQNKAVDQAVRTAGFSETSVWSRMNTGAITALTLTNAGAGYTSAPAVTFTGGCATGASCGGAAATATLGQGVATVAVTNGGSGYTAPPVVSFGGTGEGGEATAVLGPFGVTGIAVTAGGTLYSATPTVTLSAPPAGGTQATASATVTGGVITAIAVTAAGSGYTSAPTVSITDTAGTGAAAAATITASVVSVTVTSAGAYASTPTVQFSGGGGTGAAATATLTGTNSLSITLTNAGGGYTTAPTVTISSAPTGGTTATAVATIGSSGCGTAHTCYPPAVNYTPFYFLINGQAFDKTNPGRSLFATAPAGTATAPVSGNLLVRLVNAGLRMHVPSIVGSQTTGFNGVGASATVGGFTLIAEDGNPLPSVPGLNGTTAVGAPRVQTDVFMAAGKTYDVMVNVPAPTTTGGTPPSLPIYDRELSLSANSSVRDAGMLAYISANGALLPVAAGTTGSVFASAQANPDTYNSLAPGQPLTISDPSKGVIANDINVYGVELSTPPTNGTLTCNAVPGSPVAGICANGTFTYVPNASGISVTLVSGGSGYTAPVVTFSPPPAGGTAPAATATVGSGTGVTSVSVTSGGSGYTAPSVTFSSGGGSGATASATLTYAVASVSGGSGYVVGDTLTFTGGGGTGAAASVAATGTGGSIAAVTFTSGGSGYTSAPTVGDSTTPTATGAVATLASTGAIGSINVLTSGSGYSTAPTVNITDGTGSSAAATAVLGTANGVITAINVTYSGSGYTTAPSITITGGAGSGASATASVAGFATSDVFYYEANGNPSLIAKVTLGPSGLTSGKVTANPITYTSKMATFLKISSPGVLSVDSDANNLPLQVVVSSITQPTTQSGVTINMDPQGGFTAIAPSAGTYTFTYKAQNSLGTQSTPATVTLVFPVPSNLQVHVLDAQAYKNCNGNATCIAALVPFPDYRWIIEEDKTFWVDPNCTTNNSITTPGCPTPVASGGTIPTFGTNFHTSNMEFVAQGCTGALSCEGGQTMLDTNPSSTTFGTHIPAVCDMGNGACRPDTTGSGFTWVNPSQVALDPAKRYYISVLPGDAANPFPANTSPAACNGVENTTVGNSTCGHTMSGAAIPPACNILGGTNACTTTSAFTNPVQVLVLPTPLPTGRLSVIVFEDDFPLNGEQDGGGGNGTVAPIEPGLGGFNLVLWDTFGGLGDVTGQDTYDVFNQPLSNGLAGTIDPVTGLDACPVSATPLTGPAGSGTPAGSAAAPASGITGMIVTCPKYESDGFTLSPLAGQAVIYNLMPDKFSVQAYPGADRIARGEEWLQTNTLDGQHPHDSFIRIGEPGYFQEYGPAGFHVAIGFANPAIINARHQDVCNGFGTPGQVGACTNTIDGQVDVQRISRTPDQRLYPSGSRDAFAWTQCWVSLGDPDGEDFMFTKCDANGNFRFTNVPGGNWRLTIGDQWNDQIIDGLSTPANVGCSPNGALSGQTTTCPGGQTLHMGNIGVQQWQANLYTRVFIDDNKNGILDPGEIGIPFLYTRIYYRDGSNANGLNTDFNGVANFNETYPLFNWYVVEADSTRYKTTGIHTVYDAGGPADGSPSCGNGTTARQCGTSTAYNFMTNTYEAVPLPADLHVPGAVYCAKADCAAEASSFATGTANLSAVTNSTGRIDPPWVTSEGWAGLTGLSNYIDFGKAPYASCPPACVSVPTSGGSTSSTTQVGENGGIHGQVTYASTRPFDDADQMILQPWEPLVPGVTINLYQEGFAADGVTPTLKMVDTTITSSWDYWAQGFWPNSSATPGTGQTSAQKPYMNCPGQGTATGTNADLFFFTLFDQPNFLDQYNSQHNGGMLHTLPYNAQYKCYDSMHMGNQIQPAPYNGEYYFPSSLGINATTGKPLTAMGSTNGVASNMAGTNCTICVANPDSSDAYRVGTPMLPPGKYVVEVIMPPGYEVYKEEDKNLLIGDNFIAPVTQQFGGLGTDIFIIPDQASVATMYDESAAGYNPNNFQDQTTALGLGDELSGVPGYPGFQDPVWPCVGEQRVVPDYLSLFPHAQEVAPFAGATRPLCDRKEVTLVNQASVRMHFAIFTSTHIASKFAGGITDDFTSEFDPFSPQFGEKFAPPNMAVSTKDYLGNELSRVYSDHWGTYDGLTFSSWEVNPPNITGYSPSMMVQCMNDPGPVKDTNPSSPTYGQMITDALYNPAYSNFCYEQPFMPGLTLYADTPVVPTQAFVGAAYNNPDCSYPDATPAIKEVDGDGIGPYVSRSGVTLTITALGDQQVSNSAYSGPSASVVPFNAKTITRHYGFGSQCLSPTAGSTTCNTLSSVTIGGRPAVIDSWSDTQILVTVPTGVPPCPIQQQALYGGSAAQCGQLVITAGNGKQSIDTVTVTIGGKAPTHVSANQTVQGAIDAAHPGDLIMVDPGSHNEMLIMWKPVRLQGVGAASSIINASAFPAGTLLDPWRRHINCLFGLTLSGVPYTSGTNPTQSTTNTAPYDPSGNYSCPDAGWQYFTAQPNAPQIDRLPLEAVLGWDATLNGNLAEQLQEPSLMGAFEGAGITVLGKGVDYHGASPWTDGNEGGAFPTGTTLLSGVGPVPTALPVGDANPLCVDGTSGANRFPSDFTCNPSSIDGLSIDNSSQGGGGIFAHGWAHHLQIANNRVFNNAGTLTGGIGVGQGEFPTPYVAGGAATNAAPGSCSDGTGFVTNQHLPYCLQLQVNVHNNYISNNSSLGDELFSGTLSGGGGVSFCTGNDYYLFNYNWVCGNLSSAEGGGVVHLGEIQNGDIEHNTIALNQSDNPTIPTNGGGIHVQGTPDTDPTCGTQIDADCPPGLSDGIGHNLVINANLIQGNMAESGSGGGIRLQQVNGSEVSTFFSQPNLWNNVSITNNMIVNNVAGWDGAGISLQDSLNVSIVNNTIASNDSLASSGVLTQSIGTPDASAPPGSCVSPTNTTTSCPQSAGVTSTPNSSLLTTTFTGLTLTCPNGTTGCAGFSNPLLQNNVIWQNRSFYIGITGAGTATQNQQNLVSLFNSFTGTAAPVQAASGQCTTGVSYWDIGVRGDSGPGPNTGSGFALNPTYSVLDDAGYAASNQTAINPSIVSQYCNGSRVPPTCTVADGCGGPSGYGVPPGIVDASTPNPVFSLTPSATVDEGNNWINVSWGPLALSDDSVAGGANGNYGGGSPFGNYALASGSSAIDYVPLSSTTLPTATIPQLTLDFYGNPRPDAANPNHFDVGAVEFQNTTGTGTLTSISPPSGQQGFAVNVTITGTGLTLASAVNVSGNGIAVSNVVAGSATTVTATFTISATATLGDRNVTVTTPAGTTNAVTFTVVAPPAPTLTSIAPATEIRGTSVPVVLTGTNFIAGANVVTAPAATGVTVTGVTVVNSTTIDATINSTLSASIGSVNVEVVTGGGASNTLPFAITGPVLTGISPASANRNSTGVAITLTGSGLTGTSAVNFSGNGITVTGFTIASDTSITATVNISPFATAGASNVTVTAPGGNSNAVTFTVTVPPIGLKSIMPTTGARGTTQLVTLTGISFVSGTNPATGIAVTGGGITVNTFTVVSDTTITANFVISPTAALTARNVTVTTTGAPTTPVTFTVVNPGTPVISSITPASGLRRTFGAPNPVAVVIAGSNFTAGSTVAVVAPANGLFITGVTLVSPTQINATFNTTVGAVIGPRSITVTNPGGTSSPAPYTVLGPVLTSINPTSALRGQGTAIPIDLFGSGLTGATAVTVSGGGITVGPVSVVSDAQVHTTFTISAFAGGTARNVSVTAPGGVSNTVAFTVTIPATPTLTNLNPATGVRGTSVPVTLTGTGFITGETTVNVTGAGGGITISGVTVTSPTTVTATFAIASFASLTTPGSVTATVAGAAASSNALPFTVQGATLTSIAPNTGVRGTTVPVTFTGANLNGATGLTGLGGGGGGVTFNSLTVVNSTTVTANLVISTGATVGILNIGLATPIGNTNTIPFTVQGATLTAISPTSATHPATGTLAVPITITGTNLTGTTALTGLPAGVTVATGTLSSTATSITATLNVASTATIGAANIGATTAAGATTNTVTFTVN